MKRAVLGIGLSLAAVCGCAEEPRTADVAPVEEADSDRDERTDDEARAEGAPPRSALLIDGDLGGWTPPDELLERALALGDDARKAEALAELDALGPRERVNTLRAGLRLRDTTAATACAARLEWKWIDNWECARTVALLTPEVFRPGTEVDFEQFRSYLGSVEVNAVLDAIPEGESAVAPDYLMGQLHRVLRAEHLLPMLRITYSESSSDELVDGAWGNVGLLTQWSDRHRTEAGAYFWELDPEDLPPPTNPGLHPMMAEILRGLYLTEDSTGLDGQEATSWLFRWMMDERPGPQDTELIVEIIEAHDDDESALPDWSPASELCYLWLGLLRDAASEEFLRSRAEEKWDARVALARRGDPAQLDWLETEAHDSHIAFGVFLEAAPERARAWLSQSLLGEDEERARAVLERLNGYLNPNTDSWPEPDLGIVWSEELFDGFEAELARADIGVARRGAIAVVVPGCRTRRLARQVVSELEESFPSPDDEESDFNWFEGTGPWLEVGAPDELRALLRDRIRHGTTDERAGALWLLGTVGDPTAGALLLTHARELGGEDAEVLWYLESSPGPEVVAYVRGQVLAAEGSDHHPHTVRQLAIALGLPERAANALDYEPLTPPAYEALLDGRATDALALQLAAFPDELFEVGDVHDPRVRAYLDRLRSERHLGHYWLATAELALQDADARAELWEMLQDGRYRTQDCLDLYTRTLGHDLSTIPFWISELESQCCRINLGGGQIFDQLFALEDYSCPWATSHEQIAGYWKRHDGKFVWSRLAEHFVPAAR